MFPNAFAGETMSAAAKDDRVEVSVAGKPFTAYKFAATQKYPYFYPVNGPRSGQSVTTESSEPYPHHHSLFFGCDKVNGANFWQDSNDKGQIVSQTPKIVEASDAKVIIEDACLWQVPGKEPIMRDTRTIAIVAPDGDTRIIDFAITLEPLVDITIEKTNHSLFSARVAPELAVPAGGTLVNAEGLQNEKGTFGVASAWCDFTGARGGVTEGIAIIQNPGNRWYPSNWFTRDYGFFSPTPMYWLEGDKLQLPKGEPLSLAYRVIVHTGSADAANIAAHFSSYATPAKN